MRKSTTQKTIRNVHYATNRIRIFILRIRKLKAKLLKIFGIIGNAEYREIRAEVKNRIRFIKQSKSITADETSEFIDWVLNHQTDKSQFVPLSKTFYKPKAGMPKLIAHYLPQYHRIPQNDAWHGAGFTEWTNCARATPQYTGHHQPRVPYDVGFYNLDHADIMRRQIQLAKQYGIHGFCFYYYWFHGERIMEKPLFNFLADKSLDMPFMMFWANEDWTSTWGESGKLGEKIYDAGIIDGDAKKFIEDILPFFNDPRYIRINGRPALIIYKHKHPRIGEFISDIKKICAKKIGVEPFVMIMNNHETPDDQRHPKNYNADAVSEFNIFMKNVPQVLHDKPKIMNPLARFRMWDDTVDFIENRKYMYDADYLLYRGCYTGFDDTARKIYGTGARIGNIEPKLYKKWLSDIIGWTKKRGAPGKLVFISAWNEWAEAMYLEPDTKNGYAYLQATKEALEENEN